MASAAHSDLYLHIWLLVAGTKPHVLVQHGPCEGLKHKNRYL